MNDNTIPPVLKTCDEVRNQAETEFTPFLKELVEGKSKAVGAVFFDREGEAIDYYAHIEEYQLKIAAAHLEIIARFASEAHLSLCKCELKEILFASPAAEFRAISLGDGYHLGIITTPERTSQTRMKTVLKKLIPGIKKAAGL